jgi:hypothetical protein
MHRPRLLPLVPLIATLVACHGHSPGVTPGPETQDRAEATLTAALRWVPTSPGYRGLPVVLMAGSAHGDFRQAWIDSLQSAAVIHHTCTALTVLDCPDSVRAAYVGFSQPVLATDRSAEVGLTILALNPAACGRDTTQSSEVTGKLRMPWPGSSLRNYRWTEERSVTARC